MIIKIITFSLFINFFCIISLKSQGDIENRVKNAIYSLKADISLMYSFSCTGCSTSDSCMKEESHYLLWKKNGRFFIKRFDYCKDFEELELKKSNPLTFYLKNRDFINKEDIKPPTYRKVVKTPKKIDTVLLINSVDHSYFHNITLRTRDRIVRKEIDTYDLTERTSSDGLKNIYYKSNHRSKTYALINRIGKLIKHLNNENFWK